ncbi:hypothetical protein KKA24_01435 [Patescibacteria group bacterium]|nr:hypothetical protein [Patescibacteria group bacterium]
MNVITIPEKLSKKGDLIIISRSDYEDFLELKKIIPLVDLSKSEKKALKEGKEEIKRGEYLTLDQLKDELEN